MKEIGGYFEAVQGKIKKEYYSDLIPLNTARNALVYLCKARNISKIYLPYFLCDSCYLVCERERIKFEFYDIDDKFLPIFEKELNNDEFIYIVNYYGFLSNRDIKKIKRKYKNIIIDNVQAFYSKPIKGVDTIYSCRKFFGVSDGAYLSTNVFLNYKLENDNSDNRTKHLYGRLNHSANEFFDIFKENEKKLYSLPLLGMSTLTHDLLSRVDYKFVKTRRSRNYRFLQKKLKQINQIKLCSHAGQYVYPLKVDNAAQIRKQLIAKKVFIPLLWPNILNKKANELSNSILPIPCDQRYDIDDMRFIVEEILKCMKI